MESAREHLSFNFRFVGWSDAWTIGGWRYAPPYDIYNLERMPLLEAVLLRRFGSSIGFEAHSVWTDAGEVVGLFTFTKVAQGGVTLGLALRPDLTGKGLGLEFVQAGVAFAKQRFSPRFLRLDVAESNLRAIKVYERAGFQLGKRTFQWKARPRKPWHREMRLDG